MRAKKKINPLPLKTISTCFLYLAAEACAVDEGHSGKCRKSEAEG